MNQDIKIAFISIIVLRLSQLFLDYNYDRPDEYWQGPEIAHKMAYGYGF
jgi:phosphatidylinositol glycan class B